LNNITITIQAPELVKAILTLAEVLEQGQKTMQSPTTAQSPSLEPESSPETQTQIQTNVPTTSTTPTSTTPPQVPTGVPTATSTQTTPAQAPEPVVPTATQTYTMEQLAVAATQLVDAGRREELVQLLRQFGVEALTQLPKEQYGAFATALRQMGAKI